MNKSIIMTMIANILKYGYFFHFLATFGIENGSMITLVTFGYLKFAKTIKLKITWSHRVIFHILKIC